MLIQYLSGNDLAIKTLLAHSYHLSSNASFIPVFCSPCHTLPYSQSVTSWAIYLIVLYLLLLFLLPSLVLYFLLPLPFHQFSSSLSPPDSIHSLLPTPILNPFLPIPTSSARVRLLGRLLRVATARVYSPGG